MSFIDYFDTCVRARCSFILITSVEEERIHKEILSYCEERKKALLRWDCSSGFVVDNGIVPEDHFSDSEDPVTALNKIKSYEDPKDIIYMLPDFHDYWKNASIKRIIKSCAQKIKYTTHTIVVTSPVLDVPMELEDEITIIDYDLPNIDDIKEVFEGLKEKNEGVGLDIPEESQHLFFDAALGMTASQARCEISKLLVSKGARLNLDHVDILSDAKKEIIRKSAALEYYPMGEDVNNIGGLQAMKNWLRLRTKSFTKSAKEYGIIPPRGVLLMGIPGTGKSLTAKMIGSLWHLPLIRLDIGSLFGSLVGESEARTRNALKLVETISPCVLWIDEIEKGLGSIGAGNDGGTSQRVLATVLTWMQEKKKPVFIVATANNIDNLPPEILRAGRFDERFFLDVPRYSEREEIFEVHIRKRGRDPRNFDIQELAQKTSKFVGAEIEQSIVEAMFLAFNDNEREFTTEDIIECIDGIIPIVSIERERIFHMRKWLIEGRAKSASYDSSMDEDFETGEEKFTVEDRDLKEFMEGIDKDFMDEDE